MSEQCPYLTSEIPPVAALFRARPEDFVVEEVPEYDPCGVGDHLYTWVEKRGISTRQMVKQLAAALGISPERIGVAGQKDARGITRQMVSLERVDPIRLKSVRSPGINILDAARHRTKLRLGSLRGNRFVIRLREVAPDGVKAVRAALEILARRGVPNYFGPQRFGVRGDTWEVGRALLRGDQARVRAIVAAWPAGREAASGTHGLDPWLVGFAVSAYQAWVFNAVLAERLPGIDRVLAGDLAFLHDTGRIVPVRDAAAEQPRAERFLLSATGPIVGHTMAEPAGEAAAIEQRILAAEGIRVADLPRSGPLKCVGGRRPLRFQPSDPLVDSGEDELGAFLDLRFTLPRGCYATAVLREICKDALRERPGSPGRRQSDGPAAEASEPAEEARRIRGEGEAW
jgi:tRNA pseudouridine13 synthase